MNESDAYIRVAPSLVALQLLFYAPTALISCWLVWMAGSVRVSWRWWDFFAPIVPGFFWIAATAVLELTGYANKGWGNYSLEGVILGLSNALCPIWRLLHGSGPDALMGVILIVSFLAVFAVALAYFVSPIYFGF
jgi:hypothetical protein